MKDGNASTVELIKQDEPERVRSVRLQRERQGMSEPTITSDDALRIAEEVFEPEFGAWYRRLGLGLAVSTHLRHYYVVIPRGVDGPHLHVTIDCYSGKILEGPFMRV